MTGRGSGEKRQRKDVHKTLFGIKPRYLGDFPFPCSDPPRFTSVQRSEQRNVVVPLVGHDVEVSLDQPFNGNDVLAL